MPGCCWRVFKSGKGIGELLRQGISRIHGLPYHLGERAHWESAHSVSARSDGRCLFQHPRCGRVEQNMELRAFDECPGTLPPRRKSSLGERSLRERPQRRGVCWKVLFRETATPNRVTRNNTLPCSIHLNLTIVNPTN